MKRIVSYNLNGIRSALNKGLFEWFAESSPDVLCIQETKAQPDQVELEAFRKMGYRDYWHSAEKKGYSGVLILTREKPDHVEIGMRNPRYDAEGRVIRADYGELSILDVYIPSGTTGDIRQEIKMAFLDEFLNYLNELRKSKPKLLVCGDFNIAHNEIDIHNPAGNKNNSGFLPEERAWMDKFVAHGYIDTFRHFNKEPNHYTWWDLKSGARERNVGWRLDYFFVSENLLPSVSRAFIMPEVMGSDHCPVGIVLKIP